MSFAFFSLNSRYLYSLISQAELSAEIGYHEQAIDLFDNIATISVNDSIHSFKVKNYIFWQCLCIIALDDWVRLEKKFKQFIEQYPSFADSRECAFINVNRYFQYNLYLILFILF